MTKHTKIQKAFLLKNIHEGLGVVGITTVTEGSTRYCVAGLLQARQESMVLDTRFPAGMTSYLDIFAYNDEAAPLGTGFVVNNRL